LASPPCSKEEGLDTPSDNAVFMVNVEEAILPFIPMVKRGVAIEDLLMPIMAEHEGIDEGEVIKALKAHVKPTVNHIPSKTQVETPKINGMRYREMMSRREYEKTMNHLQEIVNIVIDSPNGVRKSTILRQLRKENSHWRPKITRWLHDLLEDGVILSDGFGNGTLYFPPTTQVQDRERKYHRLVAESLQVNGEMTMTQLSKRLGCDGGSNRHKVRKALEDLANEGWIISSNRNRWLWNL